MIFAENKKKIKKKCIMVKEGLVAKRINRISLIDKEKKKDCLDMN